MEILVRLLSKPKYELLPFTSTLSQVKFLPTGARVSVAASPAKGPAASVELGGALAAMGFDVTVHLPARAIESPAQGVDLVEEAVQSRVTKFLIVGGDVPDARHFTSATAFMREINPKKHGASEVGVAGYPGGHSWLSAAQLEEARLSKLPFADYIVSQMCFNPSEIASWASTVHKEGQLRVDVGLPGVCSLADLLRISSKIGVGASVRFLKNNTSLFASALHYSPSALLEDVVREGARADGLHLYTFNQVEHTERWRREYLQKLQEQQQELEEGLPP